VQIIQSAHQAWKVALYEQIYALAGLCQYHRITQEWEVLEDIHRTLRAFQDFYRDDPRYGYTGTGGYFSHIDYATLRPDVESLGQNRLRKNWNSIGDHIPAYLVNLILALDPLPRGGEDHEAAEDLLKTCHAILAETSKLILTHFPDPSSKFVNERFHADWSVDHGWGWQQNRAIVGHNLKIAVALQRARFEAAHARGDLAALAEPAAFAPRLAPLRRIAWVIYAKRPFGGAEQVLDYLSRYTHRVAIANSRLLACEDGRVCFRWKDYRVRDKTKTMSLDVDEFIRRFLLHVLPDQFRRIRHFGFLANACRTAKLARIRAALALPEPTPVAEPTDYRERYALLIGQRIDLCPCCGGRMVEVGFTARTPRNSSPYRHPRCDTS
jgi:hypothetical protein